MEYKVNLLRETMPDYEDYCKLIKTIWDNTWMTNSGVLHDELESKLRDYLCVENALLYTNGHLALEGALQSLKLTGEVITTPYTFISTTEAIVRSGLTPVFCDIDPVTCTIDPNKIEELITDKTVAIMGVHVYGMPCDVYAIEKIAKKYGLKVIYDAAHCFGTRIDGKGIGSFGDASVFSMHATKVFNTAEGGLICFQNSAFNSNFKNIRNFGFCDRYDADVIGFNAKMSEFHAAVGLCNLKKIDEYIEKRKAIFNHYSFNFEDVSGLSYLKFPSNIQPNYSYYPIFLNEESNCTRDQLFDHLDDRGIQSRKYFYPLTNQFSCFNGKIANNYLPVASHISNNVICLPLYPDLSFEQIEYVIKIVKEVI